MKKSPKTAPKVPQKIVPKAAVASLAAVVTADIDTTLTDDQMQQLAQFFHDISVEIGQVRLDAIKAGAALTDPGIVQLQGYIFSLKNVSDNLAVQSANLTLQNADQALQQIAVATQTADHALDKLTDIDKAVQIASAVIVLGAAITTRDPSQILGAAKSVITACGVSVS
jgi:hypothetical protein